VAAAGALLLPLSPTRKPDPKKVSAEVRDDCTLGRIAYELRQSALGNLELLHSRGRKRLLRSYGPAYEMGGDAKLPGFSELRSSACDSGMSTKTVYLYDRLLLSPAIRRKYKAFVDPYEAKASLAHPVHIHPNELSRIIPSCCFASVNAPLEM
jgi:hypothetical protein